jgi:hypothetical protein
MDLSRGLGDVYKRQVLNGKVTVVLKGFLRYCVNCR